MFLVGYSGILYVQLYINDSVLSSQTLKQNVFFSVISFKGDGVKVAIFDTGLPKNHPHFRKVMDRTNWTEEKTLDDGNQFFFNYQSLNNYV